MLSGSGSPRYLHTGVMMYDLMIVFGGNTHNDTQISLGAKCYSPDFLAYNPGKYYVQHSSLFGDNILTTILRLVLVLNITL